MRLAILHLSDIHLKRSNNVITKRRNRIFDFVKNTLKRFDKCLVVISGDIAFSGKGEEYSIATDLILTLRKEIENYTKLSIDVITAPGNHDCYFDPSKVKLRELALNSFDPGTFTDIDEEILEKCLEPQKYYFEFVKSAFGVEPAQTKEKLLTQHHIQLENYKIRVLAYNTSWFSRRKEELGRMLFPVELFAQNWENQEADVVISVLHHPYNWQTPENARDFRNHLESTSDIVISGHEHTSSKGYHSNLSGNNTWYFEAPVLQDSKNKTRSGFNIIGVDLTKAQIRMAVVRWVDGRYELLEDTDWKDFQRGPNLKSKKYNLQQSTIDLLNNAGASFTHPGKDDVLLDDIFVYPNLVDVNPEKSEQTVISSINLEHKGLPAKILVVGEESSGKTILLKRLSQGFYNNGFLPISLSVSNINKISKDRLQTLVEDSFRNQYKDDLSVFQQEDNTRVVILIDDFHLFKGEKKFKGTLLKNLISLFPNIVLTGNRLLQYEDYTSNETHSLFKDFDQYEILEAGPELRDRLIRKWHRLSEDFLEENEILKRIDNSTTVVNEIIGKNLIPAYPFYIITILQSAENSIGKNPEYSLHGYYYQLIINQALGAAVSNYQEIGAYHNCITNYCYFLFDNKIRLRPILEDDFRTFYKDFAIRYDITTISSEKMLNKIVK